MILVEIIWLWVVHAHWLQYIKEVVFYLKGPTLNQFVIDSMILQLNFLSFSLIFKPILSFSISFPFADGHVVLLPLSVWSTFPIPSSMKVVSKF